MIFGQHKETENYKHWTAEEERILRDNCGKMSFESMLNLFSVKRSVKSLRKKSAKLGLISDFRRKIYSHNENFWNIPNELNSYWAGFIFADGCINKNSISDNYSLDLSLASKDLKHLETFKNDVGFTGAIKNYRRKKYKTDGFIDVSTLIICSIRKWKDDLERNFGIIRHKTRRGLPPNLDSAYLKLCFCIGYLDGDGWITHRKSGDVVLGYVSSNLNVLTWIRDILDENFSTKTMKKDSTTILKAKGNYHYFTISGKRALVIIDYLRKFPIPRLVRKWDKPSVSSLIEEQKAKFPHLFISQSPAQSVIADENKLLALAS